MLAKICSSIQSNLNSCSNMMLDPFYKPTITEERDRPEIKSADTLHNISVESKSKFPFQKSVFNNFTENLKRDTFFDANKLKLKRKQSRAQFSTPSKKFKLTQIIEKQLQEVFETFPTSSNRNRTNKKISLVTFYSGH